MVRLLSKGELNIFPENNADPNEPEEGTLASALGTRDSKTLDNDDSIDNKCPEKPSDQSLVPSASLTIDPEFQNLLRPLSEEEYNQLEENLIKDRFPVITVWKNHNTIIDGHHSYAIALQHNIPYTVRKIELESRSAVVQWMYDLQLGRRNLTEKEKSYYRTKQYELLKQERGGDRKSQEYKSKCQSVTLKSEDQESKCQSVTLKSEDQESKCQSVTLKSADRVAEKTGVDKRTIYRDVKYSKAVEAIAQKLDCSPQKIINSSLSRKQVKEMVHLPVETIKQKLENPTFIEPRELPELKVGDVVRIRSDRKNKDFVGYNGSFAICDQVYHSSVRRMINVKNYMATNSRA